MVAIVAGNGLGLLNTSLNILGWPGVLGQSALGQGGQWLQRHDSECSVCDTYRRH